MKVLVPLLLCLLATPVQAEPAVEKSPAAQATKFTKPPERPRAQVAAIAVTFTDDADSILLPPFASRTTTAPMRFLRVGVEWSF